MVGQLTHTDIHFGFTPDALRARALNDRMHAELGSSLDHLRSACGAIVDVPQEPIDRLIGGLRRGQSYPAEVFATYYELAFALQDDRLADAVLAWKRLAAAAPAPSELQIQALGEREVGADGALYERLLNDDDTADLVIRAPQPEVAAKFRKRLQAGLLFLRDRAPELSAEIEAIVREIVIVGSDPAKPMQIDGASHFQLWGALFLNSDYHADDIAIVEVLAHETAHSLLFGFCIDEGLVENDDAERFASPLRADLRPMDGIYHATFVSARMHWAMNHLITGGRLSELERGRAAAAAHADLQNFDAGFRVVEAHGRLTATGRALMQGAKAYMDSVR